MARHPVDHGRIVPLHKLAFHGPWLSRVSPSLVSPPIVARLEPTDRARAVVKAGPALLTSVLAMSKLATGDFAHALDALGPDPRPWDPAAMFSRTMPAHTGRPRR
jgi:hypothetical protein